MAKAVQRNRQELFRTIADKLRREGAKKLGCSAHTCGGEETPESDIDLLVEFEGRKSLLDIVRIERELSEEIGIKVDLLTRGAISPLIRGYIEKELEIIS